MPGDEALCRLRDQVAAPLLGVGLVLGGWAMLGAPERQLAHLFWPDRPAPWERVTATYLPDRASPDHRLVRPGLPDLGECRAWVYRAAQRHGDRRLARGDWHCTVVAAADAAPRLHLK